jgi:hypothetical protein
MVRTPPGNEGNESYGSMNADPAVAAFYLIAISPSGSETIEIPFPLLSFPIERFQGLDQAVYT